MTARYKLTPGEQCCCAPATHARKAAAVRDRATKEIVIRIAIGARKSAILSQFLVEAVTLSILGRVAGIAFGVYASTLISHFAGWNTLVSPAAIVLAFVFSGLVGVFFGHYPARRAASLNPLEALRYESAVDLFKSIP